MARKLMDAPASALDSLDDVSAGTVPPEDREGPVSARLEGSFPIPIGRIPEGVYLQERLDLRLTRRQSQGLRVLFEGLHGSSSRLADGRHVDNAQEAVRWILEQVADIGGVE